MFNIDNAININVFISIMSYINSNIFKFRNHFNDLIEKSNSIILDYMEPELLARVCLYMIGFERMPIERLKKNIINKNAVERIVSVEYPGENVPSLKKYLYISSEPNNERRTNLINKKIPFLPTVISIDAVAHSAESTYLNDLINEINLKNFTFYYLTPAQKVDASAETNKILYSSGLVSLPDQNYQIILKWGNKIIMDTEYKYDKGNFTFKINQFFTIKEKNVGNFEHKSKITLNDILKSANEEITNGKKYDKIVYILLYKTLMDTNKPIFLRIIQKANEANKIPLNYISITIDQIQSYITSIFAKGVSYLANPVSTTPGQKYMDNIILKKSTLDLFEGEQEVISTPSPVEIDNQIDNAINTIKSIDPEKRTPKQRKLIEMWEKLNEDENYLVKNLNDEFSDQAENMQIENLDKSKNKRTRTEEENLEEPEKYLNLQDQLLELKRSSYEPGTSANHEQINQQIHQLNQQIRQLEKSPSIKRFKQSFGKKKKNYLNDLRYLQRL
jgi:hypothetical protein